MRSSLTQLTTQCIIATFFAVSCQSASFISRRSALESGLALFETKPSTLQYIPKNKNDKGHVVLSHTQDEWVPGHVHGHAFIPAHLHHVLVPVEVPTARKSHSHEDKRMPVGGYGVGVDFGGAGAGHGFQVHFDDLLY